MQKLSIALAVYNEQKNIEACLRSVHGWVNEIVVVDGGSTDDTVDIAKRYQAKVIRTTNPPIFHLNKQKALDASVGPWILQLDADEVIPTALKDEILQIIKEDEPNINGYYIPRRNFFWGHFMKKGGQYPDYVIRLVRKGKAHFPNKSVHEQIEVEGKTAYIKVPMDHMSYRTAQDYWRKADTYTSLTAQEMIKHHTPKTFMTWGAYMVIKPLQTFISLFIRHKGFVDGWYGLIFAYWSALHFPIAYKKFIQLKTS